MPVYQKAAVVSVSCGRNILYSNEGNQTTMTDK